MPLPDSLMNILLAPKAKAFYETLIQELNSKYKNENF